MRDRISSVIIKKYLIKHLWRTQGRRCPICHLSITAETGWQLRHIVRKVNGGLDNPSNLVMLHPKCHHTARGRGFSVVKRLLRGVIERLEPYAGKLARAVLRGWRRSNALLLPDAMRDRISSVLIKD